VSTTEKPVDILNGNAVAVLRTPNAIAILRAQIVLALKEGLQAGFTPEQVDIELIRFLAERGPINSENEGVALATYIEAVIETEVGRPLHEE
jgi:hypothetical protein